MDPTCHPDTLHFLKLMSGPCCSSISSSYCRSFIAEHGLESFAFRREPAAHEPLLPCACPSLRTSCHRACRAHESTVVAPVRPPPGGRLERACPRTPPPRACPPSRQRRSRVHSRRVPTRHRARAPHRHAPACLPPVRLPVATTASLPRSCSHPLWRNWHWRKKEK